MMALFFAIGRIWGETGARSAVVPSSFATTSPPAPLIALAAILPVFVLWRARFGKPRAIRATILISLLAGALSRLPLLVPVAVLIWCVPAVVLGGTSDSSLGYYFGALLQLAFGVLLIIRFRPRGSQDKNAAELNQSAA